VLASLKCLSPTFPFIRGSVVAVGTFCATAATRCRSPQSLAAPSSECLRGGSDVTEPAEIHFRWMQILYSVGQKRTHQTLVHNFAKLVTDIRNSFTSRISRKCVITKSQNILRYLTCVATLPCEILMSEYMTVWNRYLLYRYILIQISIQILKLIKLNKVLTNLWVTVTIQSVLLWPEHRHGDVCTSGQWHR